MKHLSVSIIPFEGADVRKVSFVSKVRTLRGDGSQLGESPYLIEFIPTPKCNICCSFCAYRIRNTTNRQQMQELPIETAIDILTDMSDSTKGVFVAGGGDPTCYKHIDTLLARSAERFDVGLCSNYFDISRLSDSTLAHLAFHEWSVLAGDPATFEAVSRRNRTSFNRVGQNIQRILHIRDGRDSAQVQYVIAKVLICRENYITVPAIIEYLRQFQLDAITLRLVNNYEENDVELSSNQLAELLAIATKNGITSLSQAIDYRIVSKGEKRQDLTQCYTVTEGHFAIIDCDGEVYLCVPSSSNRQFSIGNVNSARWKDIWGSDLHLNVVKTLSENCIYGRYDLSGCRHYISNRTLESIRQGIAPDIELSDFKKKLGAFV